MEGVLDYDAIARAYDELYGEEQRAKYELALGMLEKIEGLALDVGCGTGMLAEELPESAEYVGLDPSTAMLEVAKERIGGEGLRYLVCGVAECMPFRGGLFDLVFSFTVVHEVDVRGFSRELARVSKREARAVVTVAKKARVELSCLLESFEVVEASDAEELKDLVFLLARGTRGGLPSSALS